MRSPAISSLILVAVQLLAPGGDARAEEPRPDEVVEVTPPAPEPASSPPFFRYEIFGFLRLKAAVIQDDPNVAFVGRNDGFVLQNARLGLAGELGSRVAFRLSADGAVDERAGANATTGTLRFALKDAYVDILIARPLTVRVVRFEPLFDLEELIPYTERAFIDRSLESRGVIATQGYEAEGMSPGRSIGVALRSDEAIRINKVAAIGYEVAVQNGNGEYESQNDNDSVAVSGAVFATFGRSIVFVAGRKKNRTVGELPFRQTEEDLEAAAGLRLRVGPIEVAGQAILRRTAFPTTNGQTETGSGAHAQAALALGLAGGRLTLTPAYRFAIFNPSDLIAVDRVIEQTVGVTLKLNRLPLRFQLNGTHATEQAQRTLSNDRLEAGFEVAL